MQPTTVHKGIWGLCPIASEGSPSLHFLSLEGQTLCWTMRTKVPAFMELERDHDTEGAPSHEWDVGG